MALRLIAVDGTAQAVKTPPVLSLTLDRMQFGGRGILENIQFEVRAGETLALSGPSGIGKTTVMRIVAGLQSGYEGTVVRPDRIGMVFQEPTLLRWRNLRDNLRLPLDLGADAANAALAEVGLGGRGDDFPDQLSLGQQRRMALARAFAGAPKLLLLDEPFVSLDPALADDMMSVFEDLRARRDLATLIVTHSTAEADRLADRILYLSGSPARLAPT